MPSDGGERLDLSDVDVVLVEPADGSRRAIRSALSSLRIGSVAVASGVASARLMGADLLIVAVEDDEAVPMVHAIRRRLREANPFVGVIASAFELQERTVRAAADAGVDGLIAKPTPLAAVSAAVQTLALRRRDWVVTASYVGPDRRSAARPGASSAPVVEVPNPVRLKSLRQGGRLHELTETAWATIRRRQAEQLAFQAAFLFALAAVHGPGSPPAAAERARREAARLPGILDDLDRAAVAVGAAQARDALEALRRAAGVAVGETDDAPSLRRAEAAAVGVAALLQDRPPDAVAADVAAAVEGYVRRQAGT